MIIKGRSRGRAKELAAHLLRTDENENIGLFEFRGTVARSVEQALIEMEAHGLAAGSSRPLYHASISPEAHTPLTPAQIRVAVDTLETTLGFDNQPRAVVLHKKKGREHVHVVWSRVETDQGRAIYDSWNYRKHEQAARALEALLGHRPVQSSREAKKQRKRERSHQDYELRQQERGAPFMLVTDEVTRIWNLNADASSFVAALHAAGYQLARGDRRVFVIVDRNGEVHSLARRILGATAQDIRQRLSGMDLQSLPPIAAIKVEPSISPMGPQFATAAREVVHFVPEKRAIVPAGMLITARFRAGLTAIIEPGAVTDLRPIWITSRLPHPGSRYRALRAIVVSHYASRLAEASRRGLSHERDAAVDALIAERDAALGSLQNLRQAEWFSARPRRRLAGSTLKRRRGRRFKART